MTVNLNRNSLNSYDPSTGEDAIQVNSTTTAPTVFPVGRSGKLAFLVEHPANASREYCALTIHAGDEGKAWKRSQGNLTLNYTCSASTQSYDFIAGPFESARFLAAATASSTATGVTAAGDPVFKVSYINSSNSTGAAATAQVNVTAFKFPEVEYST